MGNWLDFTFLDMYFAVCVIAVALCAAAAIIVAVWCWWLSNPFRCPYLYIDFDVSGKRNPDPYDYLDDFLCRSNV